MLGNSPLSLPEDDNKKNIKMTPKRIIKRKIGILTLHYSNNNYGAVLQAFSISKLLENLGFESYIINYSPKISTLKGNLFFLLQKLFGFEFEKFRIKYIKRTRNLAERSRDLETLNKYFDAFVVGSDQVWRYRLNQETLYTYFFEFVDNEKIKVAYGASFGLDYWEGDEIVTSKVQNLMKQFHAISVREISGVNICKNIFNCKSELVIDPTLTIDKNYFFEIVAKSGVKPLKETYLAYMLLDETNETKSMFKELAKNRKLKFINIKGFPVFTKKGLYIFNSPGKWLNLIKYADIIVTDSFHCTVFSIIFHKKFVCLANKSRGVTRLQNLLNLIGEKSRFYMNPNEIDESLIFKEIDYRKIDSLLASEVGKSIDFLKKNLPN